MRVSKTVREYIEKQVQIRLEPKYEAEKKLAKEREAAVEELRLGASDAAIAAYTKYLDEHLPAVADFAKLCENGFPMTCYRRDAIILSNHNDINSVYQWSSRMRSEAKETVENIIVELELGGTKADLERLLNEVGRA